MLQDKSVALSGLWVVEVETPLPTALSVSEDVSVIGSPALKIHAVQDSGLGAGGGHLVETWSRPSRPRLGSW